MRSHLSASIFMLYGVCFDVFLGCWEPWKTMSHGDEERCGIVKQEKLEDVFGEHASGNGDTEAQLYCPC